MSKYSYDLGKLIEIFSNHAESFEKSIEDGTWQSEDDFNVSRALCTIFNEIKALQEFTDSFYDKYKGIE